MRHVIVVDLGYGDAGKGTVVDWLCVSQPVHAVVRFNGGAQAGHNVVLPDGRHHTFAQFGAGTFHRGVRSHLSRHCVVDPLALIAEADHLVALGVPGVLDRITVDRRALLATPYHRAANRAREIARGADRHGSCGAGVGEAVSYAIDHPDEAPRVGDCADPPVLRRKLRRLREALGDLLERAPGGAPGGAAPGAPAVPPVEDCVAAYRAFAGRVAFAGEDLLPRLLRAGTVVFEGAQGVLLDEWHGFHPYTTWSTTTFANAEALLADAGLAGTAWRLGVLRVVTTRHGPGPLVTEDPTLEMDEPHNPRNPWQGTFRVGHFDAVAYRYALAVTGGADALALTHLDSAAGRTELRICRRYRGMAGIEPGPAGDLARQERLTRRLLSARPEYDADPPGDWVAAVEEALGTPVAVASYGPTALDKRCTAKTG